MSLPALAPGPVQPPFHLNDGTGPAWIKVEIDFQSNWNTATPVWTDVSRAIRFTQGTGISWNLGRNDEYQEVVPGTFTITFNNGDRRFDPTYPGSPYTTGGNSIDGARPLRITCYYPTPSTPYVQFWGQVEEWDPYWPPGKDAYTVAIGVDFLGALTFAKATSLGSISLTSLARLQEFMSYAGIDSSRYSFINGSFSLLKQTYSYTDLLSACQQVVGSQNQVFYCSRTGTLKNVSIYNATQAPGGTFGESSGEMPMQTVTLANSGAYNYTLVIIQAAATTGGTAPPPVTAKVSTTAYNRYGIRDYTRNIAAVTASDAQSVASALATKIAARKLTRIKQVTIQPMRNGPAIFPAVLNADFGAQFTFKYLPPGGGPRYSEDCIVQSIRHDITASDWLVTWSTSPV